ncbi:M56 family metallopeptidase [Pseudogracilibacillus sp. SO30301A]|uniref:M56 family metallopeptidase n=1 Tax=Pseudogracilibacillus sp. SO30301A TaxID=3098291 RepID=UPI00300E026A
MNNLLSMLITLSIAGTTLLILSYLITYIFKKTLNANWHYWIRKIVLSLYIVPVFLILDLLSLFKREQQFNYAFSHFPIDQNSLSLPVIVIQIILVIWLLGAVITSFRFLYIHHNFMKKLKANCISTSRDTIAQSLLEKNMNEMNLTTNINLMFCSVNISPILLGVFKPTIVLPMYDIPDDELDLIIKHELTHFKKKDLWVKQAMLLAMILHWYNPFIYILQKNINKWSELSCDEDIVIKMSHADRKKYGETLLNIISRANQDTRYNFLGTTFSDEHTNLKRRLLKILKSKKNSKMITFFSIIIMTFIISSGMSLSFFTNSYIPIEIEERPQNIGIIPQDVSERNLKQQDEISTNDATENLWTSEVTLIPVQTNENIIDNKRFELESIENVILIEY